jgi:P4 family phage/plasmid primase-like protien
MSAWDKATGRLGAAAGWYASSGWKVLPCYGIVNGRCTCGGTHTEPKDVGKHPSIPEWNVQSTNDLSVIARWWPEGGEQNVAVNCRPSGFFVIDIDPRSGGPDSFEKFESLVEGALPPTVEAITGEYSMGGKIQRGRHLFYKCAEDEQLVGNLKKSGLPGVDIKHNGYVLITPSRHFSGVCYEWVEGKAPWEIEMAEAPEELLAALRKRGRRAETALGEGDWGFLDSMDFAGERVDVDRLLKEGIDEGSRAVDIYSLACALANKFPVNTEAGKLAVETMMIRFNAEKVRPPLELEGPGGLLMHVRRAIDFVVENPKTERLWPGLKEWANKSTEESRATLAGTQSKQPQQQQPVAYTSVSSSPLPGTIGGSVHSSMVDGDSLASATSLNNIDVPLDTDALSESEGGEPGKRSLTDTGNGRRLVDSFGPAIRYTPGLGWFHWDGGYWKPDVESLEMRELSKKIAPIVASEVVHYLDDADKQSEVIRWAQQAKSNSRINGAIESATSDPRVQVNVEAWDSDETLMGVSNGVIDLRTGELLRGRPDLYITRRAPVAYNPGIRNVRWEQFIDFATGGDKELQEWLQKAAGYSLTGLRTYDIMFLVYGPAGSGKNTLVEALVKAMGTSQYAWPLDSSILAQGDGQAHGSDLYHWAELRGRRMVWVDELPESERMKENSVKKLTGSSEISARSPGEKPFTFQSRAKLWITTNHRPIISDDAMWRRIRPVPMTHVPENPDPDLKHYLFDPEGGLPAVLSWAVEGAIKLLGSSARDALGWCSVVSNAAEIYRKNEDRIGFFLTEETKEADGASTPIKSLYAVYRVWSEERGERPMTQIAFQRKLSERGLDINGVGSRAEIKDRMLMPRSVSTGEVDWGIATRFAR